MDVGESQERAQLAQSEIHDKLWKLIMMFYGTDAKVPFKIDRLNKIERIFCSENEDFRKLGLLTYIMMINSALVEYLLDLGIPVLPGKVLLTQSEYVRADLRKLFSRHVLLVRNISSQKHERRDFVFSYCKIGLGGEHKTSLFTDQLLKRFIANEDYSLLPDPQTHLVWIEIEEQDVQSLCRQSEKPAESHKPVLSPKQRLVSPSRQKEVSASLASDKDSFFRNSKSRIGSVVNPAPRNKRPSFTQVTNQASELVRESINNKSYKYRLAGGRSTEINQSRWMSENSHNDSRNSRGTLEARFQAPNKIGSHDQIRDSLPNSSYIHLISRSVEPPPEPGIRSPNSTFKIATSQAKHKYMVSRASPADRGNRTLMGGTLVYPVASPHIH